MIPLDTLHALGVRGLLEPLEAIASDHHVTAEDILGRSRTRHIAQARRLWWVRLRAAGLSYPAIGALVGRDHSTIQHVIRKRKQAR